MYQYTLQCKRQRVKARRGESLIGLNGYMPLNRVWLREEKRREYVGLKNYRLPLTALGLGGCRGFVTNSLI